MLYSEIIAVCSQIHTKHINTLCGQNVELWNVKLAVNIVTTASLRLNIMPVSGIRRSAFITWLKHCASALDASRYQLLLYLNIPQSCQAVPRHASLPFYFPAT